MVRISVDSLIFDPDHLRLFKKSIVPSRETMLYVLNIDRFHGLFYLTNAKISIWLEITSLFGRIPCITHFAGYSVARKALIISRLAVSLPPFSMGAKCVFN